MYSHPETAPPIFSDHLVSHDYTDINYILHCEHGARGVAYIAIHKVQSTQMTLQLHCDIVSQCNSTGIIYEALRTIILYHQWYHETALYHTNSDIIFVSS